MAYGFTANLTPIGGSDYLLTVTETEAATASEWNVVGVPLKGRILRQMCVLSSGTGTTVDPVLARTSGGTGQNVVVENDTAAATVDTVSDPGIPYYDTDGTFYGKSGVDAGTDNTIVSEYLIRGGW
mgnify:CR=1 FL=1